MDEIKDDYLQRLKKGETIVIPLHEERIRVRKERRVVEEIVIRREKYIEMQKIRVPVRKEEVIIEEKRDDLGEIDK